jgi:hypothetical protein
VPGFGNPLAKALVATVVLVASLLAVGLTASSDGPFTISVQPVFLRLGVDVEIKLGSLHVHASWSALNRSPDLNRSPESERGR